MRALKFALLGLIAIVGGVLLHAATRPDAFRVERAIDVAAPPEKVFPLVADFAAWRDWSPWEKLDPAMKRDTSGAQRGKGAVYAWDGNDKVGAGRMEIVEERPAERLLVKLDFLRPFEAHNTAQFDFEAAGGGTRVTWAMFGPSPLVARVMGLFMDMDAMIGRDFEAGLTSLKALAERRD